MENSSMWRKCVVCKKDIALGGVYYSCSISTCRKSVFCSVECWDVHNGVMTHKSAWAEENNAPMSSDEEPARRVVIDSTLNKEGKSSPIPRDILIVASKLKQYIKLKHDINTSANVIEVLSDLVRCECDKAAEKAKAEGRKTLMERDF